ncbi:MAG: septal ring lytic transglycosylase RlpA family protein [Rhodopseudomonas sp.]|nr:septal ring lytic transglycosylase RlpA family protein [Rhodopseudomonas sp.]
MAHRGGTLDNPLKATRKVRRPVNYGRLWTMAAGAALFCSLGYGPASAQDTAPEKAKVHIAKTKAPQKPTVRIKSAHDRSGHFSGIASFYDKDYRGKTASGARYDGRKFTAAHRTLPFGTRVRVTDKNTHRSVTVVVNDRGPFIKGRVIDLSYAAAQALRMEDRGLVQVTASIE